MSDRIRFKLDKKALTVFFKGPEVSGLLNSAAQQIAAAAGDGYEVETAHPIRFVAIAGVHAATFRARRDNNNNNTLEKAVGGVRI